MIVVPFTSLASGCVQALASQDVRFVDVSGDDEAYWRLLAELWVAGEDFTIVEQDIVVRPDTLAGFDACPNEWCAAGYPYLGGASYCGNGCTRYRAALTQELPDLMDAVALYDVPGHGPKHYCTLDYAMQTELRARGRNVCARHGTVGHVGWEDGPSHGCVPGYPSYRG